MSIEILAMMCHEMSKQISECLEILECPIEHERGLKQE